jgi:BirA family biotin operon repressor/biotin-[acetyl-CoA-carboxylase] ligase
MTVGTAILETFYRAAGQFVSTEQLRRAAHATDHSVAAELADLQKLGYRIESHPHLGYRLLSAPDRLTADDIKAQLKPQTIGSEILVFEQTASTNDVVASLAASGAREGLVVFAESQTKGRGRQGRMWASPRGKGLWFSVLLRPSLPVAAFSRITVAASVAVARGIRQATGLDPRIKWPNDVIFQGKKVAGILTEARRDAAVVGIGMDVNCGSEDFPSDVAAVATSLLLETSVAQDRVALAAAVLSALDDCYQRALADFEAIITEWAKHSTTLGRQIAVRMGQRRVEGHAQALDGDGALLLRKDNGQIERILGADVIVEK